MRCIDLKEDTTKILVTCPVCGYQEEVEDFNKDNEICTHCGKSTYTFRTVNSIRKVFVGELKKKERNEEWSNLILFVIRICLKDDRFA